MQQKKLPSILKPYNFAKKKLSFTGNYNLENINKLKNIVNSGAVEIMINFDLEQRSVIATGKIVIIAKLICNNCLKSVDFSYQNQINIIFVNNENINLNKQYEIIDLAEEIATEEFIADEVLLALPMFAKHNYQCITTEKMVKSQEGEINPFAILKNLKG